MYDIVIVGAGIAGLNTARLLDNKNKKICILEKYQKTTSGSITCLLQRM